MIRSPKQASPGAVRLVLTPDGAAGRYWRDLWRYRELFWALAWRDILVRYKQTVLGVAWSVIRPLTGMIVFTLLFGRLLKLPTGGVAYAPMVYAGMLVWQFFAAAVQMGGESLIGSAALIGKVYFPRLIVPSTAILVSLADSVIAGILFIPLLLYYGWSPAWRNLLLIPGFLLLAAWSLGCTYFVAALNVKYRDFRYVLPFLLQIGIYVTPVGFTGALVPEKWRIFYSLNPLAGLIDLARYALFGMPCYAGGVFLSAAVSLAALFLGVEVFRRLEREFADVI